MELAKACSAILLTVVLLVVCRAQSPDQPCVKNAYPPDPK